VADTLSSFEKTVLGICDNVADGNARMYRLVDAAQMESYPSCSFPWARLDASATWEAVF
jgi:hypothetical protein